MQAQEGYRYYYKGSKYYKVLKSSLHIMLIMQISDEDTLC